MEMSNLPQPISMQRFLCLVFYVIPINFCALLNNFNVYQRLYIFLLSWEILIVPELFAADDDDDEEKQMKTRRCINNDNKKNLFMFEKK